MNKILQRVESIDNFMPWLIKLQAPGIRDELLEWFESHTPAAKIYLEIDGEKTVTTISTNLKIKQPNVSREISKLLNIGLVEPKNIGNTTIYRKTKIEKSIGLSKELKRIISTPSEKVSHESIDQQNEQ